MDEKCFERFLSLDTEAAPVFLNKFASSELSDSAAAKGKAMAFMNDSPRNAWPERGPEVVA